MALKDWVRLPTKWIQSGGLRKFRWNQKQGAKNLSALMSLIAIAHHADEDDGLAHITYERLSVHTTLSRAKISGGLDMLEAEGVISRRSSGRSSFQLNGYDKQAGWGKLPARKLYDGDCIIPFRNFTLRNPTELHALKMYLLFVERRDRETNLANISYDKIVEYIDIDRNRIKSGLSFLAANNLVHIEYAASGLSEKGVSNCYRITHLDSRVHMGTRGRGMLPSHLHLDD